MKKLMILATLLVTSHTAVAGVRVVYGQDDRKDMFQVYNALHLKLARSTAGMIRMDKFAKTRNANIYDLINLKTLERSANLCTSEKFGQQLLAPTCSGFLVGPDTLVTAGHCYNSFDTPANVCKNFAWAFNYEIDKNGINPAKGLSIDSIYLCKGVVAAHTDGNYDFAVIKLDRKVVGREPLKFRTAGKVADQTPLVVIGHPNGLPKKVATGRLTFNSEPTRFSTTLDTFHGNSGAAVFDANTGLVEGILIMGKNDYRPSIPGNQKSCKVVNLCDNNGVNCAGGVETGPVSRGEVVLRIDKILPLLSKALATK